MILRVKYIKRFSAGMLPFADAASEGLPMAQLLRLSLFQVSVGMATVMLLGTLNRVMIVELSVPATIVAAMIALARAHRPLPHAAGLPLRHLSLRHWLETHSLSLVRIALADGRSGDHALCASGALWPTGRRPTWAGEVLAAIAFLMTGLGIHMTQTAGLALATDRADEATRPRVVALLYVMFLVGMGVSSIIIGWLLRDFDEFTLIRVVQGAALLGICLNLVALWKQEKVQPMSKAERAAPRPSFRDAWNDLMAGGEAGRLLAVAFLGTMAFNMQDVLLEPYGGEVLGLSVSSTTLLTAIWAAGALVGFILAGRGLSNGRNPFRIAATGILIGIVAFSTVIFAAPTGSGAIFFIGAGLIGFGGGLFAVATLTAAMTLPMQGSAGHGLALGAWGAATATAAGLAIAFGGGLRDAITSLAATGLFGQTLDPVTTGYSFVYHTEIGLLFVTLMILGPLVRTAHNAPQPPKREAARIGLADFPT